MKELISVIMPVCNVEKYLKKSIDSVLNQTYSDLEIILVEDNSSDNSLDICMEYEKIDNRIKVIHNKENKGLSETRNIGTSKANGKYIFFIDADDYIEKDAIEVLYNELIKNNAQIALGNYRKVKENYKSNNGNNENKNSINKVNVYSSKEALKSLLEEKEVYNYVWGKLYLKDVIKDIKFAKNKKFEDIDYTYNALINSNNIVHIDKQIYYYLDRKNSITNSILIDDLYNEIDFINKRFNDINKNYPELKEINYMNRIKNIFRFHFKTAYFINKKEYKNNKKLLEEYKFYKENYKSVKSIITKYNCQYEILYHSKTLFYFIVKIRKIFKWGF